MKNYQASVCPRYEPQPLASVDNDKLRLDISSYHAQPHSIIVNYLHYHFQSCENKSNKLLCSSYTPRLKLGQPELFQTLM